MAEGRGDPLVLLPGALTGWLSWQPHAEVLAEAWRVIRMQPLCVALGLTGDPLPAGYSLDLELAAFEETLDTLALPPFDLAGWSYGGAIALSYAIHHPERVRSLTLIEPVAYWALREQNRMARELHNEESFMRTLATPTISQTQLVRFARFVGLAPDDVDPRTMPSWPVWLAHRQSLRIGDTPLHYTDSLDRVRAFDKPVLLIKGAGSKRLLHGIIDVLAGAFPQARTITLPQGHMPHVVSMGLFMARFTRFLANEVARNRA
jgi:pimeloyl-ACP methyl ester carboxylesterase